MTNGNISGNKIQPDKNSEILFIILFGDISGLKMHKIFSLFSYIENINGKFLGEKIHTHFKIYCGHGSVIKLMCNVIWKLLNLEFFYL